jgi:hypothetical protein
MNKLRYLFKESHSCLECERLQTEELTSRIITTPETDITPYRDVGEVAAVFRRYVTFDS